MHSYFKFSGDIVELLLKSGNELIKEIVQYFVDVITYPYPEFSAVLTSHC